MRLAFLNPSCCCCWWVHVQYVLSRLLSCNFTRTEFSLASVVASTHLCSCLLLDNQLAIIHLGVCWLLLQSLVSTVSVILLPFESLWQCPRLLITPDASAFTCDCLGSPDRKVEYLTYWLKGSEIRWKHRTRAENMLYCFGVGTWGGIMQYNNFRIEYIPPTYFSKLQHTLNSRSFAEFHELGCTFYARRYQRSYTWDWSGGFRPWTGWSWLNEEFV